MCACANSPVQNTGTGCCQQSCDGPACQTQTEINNHTNVLIANYDGVSEGRDQDSHEDEGEDGKGGVTATSPGPCT